MKNRKGFTITELVIVIAVIAILAAVLIPTFSSIIKKANGSKVTQEVRAAVNVLLTEKNAQIPDGTYFIYIVSEDEQKWFPYADGKLGDALSETDVETKITNAAAADEYYAKTTAFSAFEVNDAAVTAKALADLPANVEIYINNG